MKTQLLADAYNDFLKVVLANPDLHLRTNAPTPDLTPEQEERMLVIFDMLISLFERAYLVAYAPAMSPAKARRWNNWADYMREWCWREDFARAITGTPARRGRGIRDLHPPTGRRGPDEAASRIGLATYFRRTN